MTAVCGAALLLVVPTGGSKTAVDVDRFTAAHAADVLKQFNQMGVYGDKVLSILALKFGKPEMLRQPDIAVHTHIIYLYHGFTPFLVSECSDYY
jgi:hypothetical protein